MKRKTFSYTDKSGVIKTKPLGFSWNLFFFGFWVPALRGREAGIAWGMLFYWIFIDVSMRVMPVETDGQVMAKLVVFILWLASWIWISFNYNKWSEAKQNEAIAAELYSAINTAIKG